MTLVAAMITTTGFASAQTRPGSGQPISPPVAADQSAPLAKNAAEGWITRCYSSGRRDPLECAADKAFSAARTGQIVATVSFRFLSTNISSPSLLVQLPLLAFYSSKIAANAAGIESKELNLQYCDPQGCVFQAQIPSIFLEKIKSSAQLAIKFQNRNKEDAEIDLPMAGLSFALSKIE